ncbi:MAG: hypothetical protein AB1801_28820, partial [Chloroflexota bacterium]
EKFFIPRLSAVLPRLRPGSDIYDICHWTETDLHAIVTGVSGRWKSAIEVNNRGGSIAVGWKNRIIEIKHL